MNITITLEPMIHPLIAERIGQKVVYIPRIKGSINSDDEKVCKWWEEHSHFTFMGCHIGNEFKL